MNGIPNHPSSSEKVNTSFNNPQVAKVNLCSAVKFGGEKSKLESVNLIQAKTHLDSRQKINISGKPLKDKPDSNLWIFDVKPDGTCLFRAHLAQQTKNPKWLLEKSIYEVYDWLFVHLDTLKEATSDALENSINHILANNYQGI